MVVNAIPARRLERGISAEIPDWSREARRGLEWAPSRALLAAIRSYQRQDGRSGPLAAFGRFTAKLRHRFWSVVTGADIPLGTRIAGGLLMPHPNGIVIHPDVEIGPNCLIMQQVTLGVSGKPGAPRIGGHVDISVGATILGPVVVGDHALIGAHALVVKDVPAGALVLGPLGQIKTDVQAG
jgi:serine O-acetyltransferase